MIRWWPLRATDMDEVRNFVCAEPPSEAELLLDPEELDNFAELEAEVGIQEIQFPLPRGESAIVGRDDLGRLAAVCWWYEQGGPARVKLLAAGVSLAHRGSDPRVGALMMDEVIDRLLSNADGAGVETVSVFGLVRPSNGASQRMLSDAGFFYVMDSGGLQEWWARLEVPSVDE